ncbi:ammonium transporter 2-like isoform X2 [Dysidea avara]|uniref:ammonium transporter 2-like isoform X2 n=1 Tax=Dysidea avara TaxID=196820 RepID=UPI003316AA11
MSSSENQWSENQCTDRDDSKCGSASYSDRYSDASATWVVSCAILMFFMKAGFLYVEEAFSKSGANYRRRVVLAKYVDTFASTIGFWLFGYAFSGSTSGFIVGEQQDYIFWFFRFTFASNTATIIGGTLVGQQIQLRILSVFVYAFFMSAFIHPALARWMWAAGRNENLMWSPFRYCNGTRTVERDHNVSFYSNEDLGDFVFLDFAGSGVVHLCGGMAAFILQIFHRLEKKVSKGTMNLPCFWLPESRESHTEQHELQEASAYQAQAEEPDDDENRGSFLEWMYPKGGGDENVESAALGVLILWTTWFGFNAGSTESMEGKIAHASVGRIALVMALAAASGGLTSTIVSGLVQMYKRDETFNSNEIANGVLACLVAVTGCCPFIDPPWALLIGVLTILFYHLGCYIVYLLKLYDGARVFPVHGVCGFWGVMCVGIFSQNCLIREVYETLCFCEELSLPSRLKEQGFRFLYQLAGGLFIAVWSAVLCSVLFLVLWLIPIKYFFYMFGLPWLFKFKNPDRGLIEFKGNLLFTHFSEINAPSGGGDLEIANVGHDHRHGVTINTRTIDEKADSSNL